jgi:hypothetical protein
MSFSVILNRWDMTKVSAHMSMACLAAIRKFTDEPYEIIVVNNTSTTEYVTNITFCNLSKR